MTDAVRALIWLGVLALGLAACVGLHRAGVARTHVRDLLHVGAGVWVLGWPYWQKPLWPVAITAAAALGAVLLPLWRPLAPLRRAVSDADERWLGIVFYTIAFAVATFAGLAGAPWPAAAALWALALGDGIGGAIGRRFGRHRFAVPGGKHKSIEGSAAVAVFAALGAFLLAHWFGVAVSPLALGIIGVAAALAEALAPRGADNLVVPAAVFLVLRFGAGRIVP